MTTTTTTTTTTATTTDTSGINITFTGTGTGADGAAFAVRGTGVATPAAAPGPAVPPPLEVSFAGPTAPAAVHVRANGATDNAASIIDVPAIAYDFGDPGSSFDQTPGFNSAHVYDRPGTYVISCRRTTQAADLTPRQTVDTVTVTIGADARPAIHVSAAGDDARDGASSEAAVKTFARAAALLGSRSGVRLLLRRGDTFELTAGLIVAGRDVYLGGYTDPAAAVATVAGGAPLKPRLKWTGARTGSRILTTAGSAQDVFIDGIRFDSAFGADVDRTGVPYALMAMGRNIALRGCEFYNVSYGVDCSGSPQGLLVQGCTAPQVRFDGSILAEADTTSPDVTGLRAYFVWMHGSDFVLLGNAVANSIREHVVRGGGWDRVLIHGNAFSNLDRGAVDPQDGEKGCIVLHQGSHAWASGNTVHGGGIGVGPLGGPDGTVHGLSGDETAWAVVEANRGRSLVRVAPGATHAVVRNNVIERGAGGGMAFVVDCRDPSFPTRIVRDAVIAANTVKIAGTTQGFAQVIGQPDGLTIANNLLVCPGLAVGGTTAPLLIVAPDLGNITVRGNVWPDVAKPTAAHGGVNYFAPATGVATGFQTPAAWEALTHGGDAYANVALDANDRPLGLAAGANVRGVPFDALGLPRAPRALAGAVG